MTFFGSAHLLSRLCLGALSSVLLGTSWAHAASPCPPDWEPEICQLKDVVETIKKEHYTEVDIHQFLTEGVKRTVGTLSHAGFLDKKDYAEMWSNFRKGGYAGIGVIVSQDGDLLKVEQPIEDGPSEKAGIRSGDLIAEADGVSLRGMPFKESSEKLRGEPGSTVRVTLLRQPGLKKVYVTITRAFVKTATIKHRIVAPGYAWIRVAAFSENVVADMVGGLQEIAAQEPNLKGLVLDFRNNGGGSLPGAVGVVSAFLPADKRVVTTRGRDGANATSLYTRLSDYKNGANTVNGVLKDPLANLPAIYKTVPIVVLVNQSSASASELVAGALQDYGRVTVLGKPTFGKGSVQVTSQRLNETGLRINTARYFTPSGCAVHGYGITPNYRVEERPQGDPDDALASREVDIPIQKYEGWSENDPLTLMRKARLKQRTDLLVEMERKKKSLPSPVLSRTFGSPQDPMLQQALRFFQGKTIFQKRGVVSTFTPHALCGKLD